MTNLLQTMIMLNNSGYKRVAVVATKRQLDTLKVELVAEQLYALLYTGGNKLKYGTCTYYFFLPEDHTRLRGCNFDAAICATSVDEDFLSMLNFSVRLGENPIRVFSR